MKGAFASLRLAMSRTLDITRSPCTFSRLNYYRNFHKLVSNNYPTHKTMPLLHNIPKRQMLTHLTPDDHMLNVTLSQIKTFLSSNGIMFDVGYTCLHLPCPFCTQDSVPNGTLFINMITGASICYTCQMAISWQGVIDNMNLIELAKTTGTRVEKKELQNNPTGIFLTDSQQEELNQRLLKYKPIGNLPTQELQPLLNRFKLKGILAKTLTKYKIQVSDDGKSVLFPFHGYDKSLSTLHTIENGPTDDLIERNLPKRMSVALFTCSYPNLKNQNEAVLVASPMDALAIAQETNTTAFTVPQGSNHLPPEVLPLLEDYHKITIWFGNTTREWESSKVIARKLGEQRCHLIKPTEDNPSALTALQKGLELDKILKQALPVRHKHITTFSSLRLEVFDELSHVEKAAGIKWKRYPGLTKLLKGHRMGELTVFTGPTGSGKTTFMGEYSLDLCMQGVNTLWGSFEIKNVRLAKMMLTQFSLLPLDRNLDQFDYWADKFEQLPLYFMTFHGAQSIKKVLEAMSHAVYHQDIQHVVVDNVQFMLGADESQSGMDRFWKQDILISGFRKFATQHNCHVTLVMHPRKENVETSLTTSSIFGGAKASQEADNILILQDKRLTSLRGTKCIQVTKNRFDGDIGIMPMEFDKDTLTFSLKKKKLRKIEQEMLDQNIMEGN